MLGLVKGKDPMLPPASARGTVSPTLTARASVRSVRHSTGENGPLRGDRGWVELLACPLARHRRHRAIVRARAAHAPARPGYVPLRR
eukprot:4887221-Pleurochrysis_carterae.AAC.2